MKISRRLILLAATFCSLFSSIHAQQKPNIIFILTDDLGYGDIGVFFQNQRQQSGDRSQPYELTPNLDKMTHDGARFTQQYCNAPVCAPSRASLLTGVNQGNASVRDNQFDKMLENNYTVAGMLKVAGYSTVAIGKWGLQGVKETGPDWPGHPLKRGFDSFYGYMRHKDGHEHYPVEGLYDGKKEVWSDYKNVVEGLNKCYTADLWTASAKKWIVAHENGKDAAKPFFMYLAYDTPHAVLELPTQAYPEGRGLKGGIQWVGEPGHMINTASGTVDSYIYPEYANAIYDDDKNPATAEVPWPETFKRYATAVRRIDDAVGDIRQLLVDLKIQDNTLVIFTSDNGPSIESYLPASFKPNQPTFFGSYGPFDGIKRDCWEGGLRMPSIAVWPGRIGAEQVINQASMLSDWMPTFADFAHLPIPARVDGVSLAPVLTGTGTQKKGVVYVEYFESGKTPDFKEFESGKRGRQRNQMQVIRVGDLVGVRYNIQSANDDFEIYDALNDPKETVNLAEKPGYEKIEAQMKAKVLQVRHADKDAPRPYDTVAIPADTITGKLLQGLAWKYYKGNFPWVTFVDNRRPNKEGVTNLLTGKDRGKDAGIICYDGFISIPVDGSYTFSLKASGKAYVRLHEASLIDADFNYKSDEILTQTVKLKAGLHKLKLCYLADENVSPRIQFNCTNDHGGQIISQMNGLFHAANQ